MTGQADPGRTSAVDVADQPGDPHADGHDHHRDHAAQFRARFWLSLVLAVPVVITSPMVADLLGYGVPGWAAWIAPTLGTVFYLHGGWPFLTGAVGEPRARRPGMTTLVALALTVAAVASMLTTLGLGGLMLDFWWEPALLVVIMLLGHWLEMRALGQASGAMDALADLLPDSTELVDGSGVRPVAFGERSLGDVVLVRPGARVPADGAVVDGAAEVDESGGRGPELAVPRPGARRPRRHRAVLLRRGLRSADPRRLVRARRPRHRRGAHGHGAGHRLPARARTGDPPVIAISTSMSARAGILVRERLALERMRSVDAVLFDKTGTLARGGPAVVAVLPVQGVERDELLALAAAVESDSEHPLARAGVAAAGERRAARDFRSPAGRGVRPAGPRCRTSCAMAASSAHSRWPTRSGRSPTGRCATCRRRASASS